MESTQIVLLVAVIIFVVILIGVGVYFLFIKPKPCTSDKDCDTGEICSSGICVTPPKCTSDSDCSGQSTKKFCDTVKGICVECNESEGCTSDKVCSNGRCISRCKADSDCNASLCLGCVDGNCVSKCAASNPFCSSGKCLQCKQDKDCDGKNCQKCSKFGECVSKCEGSTPVCDGNGGCVQCLTDANCSSSEVCKETKCIPVRDFFTIYNNRNDVFGKLNNDNPNSPPPGYKYYGDFDTVDSCIQACYSDAECAGFTWHGYPSGTYTRKCYGLTESVTPTNRFETDVTSGRRRK